MNSYHSQNIRITKTFTFEMAHALHGYDGPCKNIHGHTYELRVTLIGQALQNQGGPKDGMMVDFGLLKKGVIEQVVSRYDHTLLLNENTPKAVSDLLKQQFEKVILTPFQPTCENILLLIKEQLIGQLKASNYQLFAVRLNETPTSYAEWYLTDNN